MINDLPSHAPAERGAPAEITTLVHDPLRNEVLLSLAGAVVLPPGSLVDLPGGEIARVSAVRLNASDAEKPTVVVQVTRTYQTVERRP